jgi:gliding motility-associated-like protein
MITVNNGADATITPVPPTCIGDSAFNLSAATGGGIWTGAGITDTASGTFDPAIAGAGPHVITYTVSGICAAVDTVTINIITTISSIITPHPSVCAGSASFNYTAASSGGIWSGTGITSTSAGTYTPTTAGTFVVTYSTPGACGTTDTVHITVIPQADATISAVAPMCTDASSISLSGVTPGGTWTGTGVTPGGIFDPAVSGPGTFTITYSIAGMCGDVGTRTITVNPIPTPAFTSLTNTICPNQCIDFQEASSPSCVGVVYTFGDGDSAFTTAPTHCYANPGDYTVYLQCTDANGCTGNVTNTNMIHVIAVPHADFSMSPNSPIEPGITVNFTNTSSATGIASIWNFDDPGSGTGNGSILTSPSHTFNDEGDYCIELISSNVAGCTDTAKYCIIVIGEGTIFIPNVFTPNSDGTNDLFLVSSHNMKEISYEIYDRWGLKIAEYSGLTGGWDGHTKNGRMAPDGTYYYILHATALNNKEVQQSGFIQLLSK